MSTTKNDVDRHRRRAARLDDPAFERFREPTARRRLAGGVIGLLALEAVVFTLAGIGVLPLWTFILGLVVLIGVFVMALGTLKASTRGVEELPEEALDERQAQIRGRVYSRAYTLISWIAFVLFALVVLTSALGWTVPMFPTLTIAVLAVQVVIIAPTLVAALGHDA